MIRSGLLIVGCMAILLAGCSRSNTPQTDPKEQTEGAISPKPVFNGYIDLLAGTTPEKQGFRATSKMQPIVVAGWAVDTTAGKPGQAMHFRVNGQLVECTYGIPRNDVAQYLKNPDYTNSGYGCNIPTNFLKPGENILEAVLTSRSTQLVGQRVVVDVKP